MHVATGINEYLRYPQGVGRRMIANVDNLADDQVQYELRSRLFGFGCCTLRDSETFFARELLTESLQYNWRLCIGTKFLLIAQKRVDRALSVCYETVVKMRDGIVSHVWKQTRGSSSSKRACCSGVANEWIQQWVIQLICAWQRSRTVWSFAHHFAQKNAIKCYSVTRKHFELR